MVATIVGKQLTVVTDALRADMGPGSQFSTLSGDWELSYEFMKFVKNLYDGRYTEEDWEKRCVKIALRRSSYNPPILNDFAILSESGAGMMSDVRYLYAVTNRYADQTGHFPRDPQEATKMDEIILYGKLSTYSLRMLRSLWDADETQASHTKPVTANSLALRWTYDIDLIEGKNYILMAKIRNNVKIRTAAETLIKFGLLEVFDLPRTNDSQRGRPPVGAAITDLGKKFCVDFMHRFDPRTMYLDEIARSTPHDDDTAIYAPSVPAQTAKKPTRAQVDPSDIDPETGENLRELFG